MDGNKHFEETRRKVEELEDLLLHQQNWQEKRQDIIDRFSCLKNDLEKLAGLYNSHDISSLNACEMQFKGFLEETLPMIQTKRGTPPSDSMLNDVLRVDLDLTYWWDSQ